MEASARVKLTRRRRAQSASPGRKWQIPTPTPQHEHESALTRHTAVTLHDMEGDCPIKCFLSAVDRTVMDPCSRIYGRGAPAALTPYQRDYPT